MAIEPRQITKENISELMVNNERLLEMVVENPMIDVPIHPRIDISTITADDFEPKFVNVEVLRAGTSGNRRRYSNTVVKEVCEQAPGCQGFLGHPDPSKYGFEFREPQSICVGSMIDTLPDGTDRCIAKMYLFKTSPLREWIPKSIAAGNPMTVSINGVGDTMRNGDYNDIIHITDLQSIDWANPGTEGMDTSKSLSVVKEMKDDEGGSGMADNNLSVQDIIKNATVTEFKAFNPDGYNAMLSNITVTELQASNKKLFDAIVESGKITEMNLIVNGKEEVVKITELQGKIDSYENEITKLKNQAEEAKITEFKTRKLSELVPENYREKIASRITGKTEKEIEDSINSEISYIREMGGLDNTPVGRQRTVASEDMKASVRSLFGIKESK